MSHLADKIREFQGDLTHEQMARRCGVSRNVFSYLANGKSVKLSTLRKIATALDLPHTDWLELLIAWIRTEVGEKDFRHLSIQPIDVPSSASLIHESSSATTHSHLLHLFGLLSPREKALVLKTIQRKEVLRCLEPINDIWDKLG